MVNRLHSKERTGTKGGQREEAMIDIATEVNIDSVADNCKYGHAIETAGILVGVYSIICEIITGKK